VKSIKNRIIEYENPNQNIFYSSYPQKIEESKPKKIFYRFLISDYLEKTLDSAKKYKALRKQRESLLYSRLCLEYILKCIYITHAKKREINYKLIKAAIEPGTLQDALRYAKMDKINDNKIDYHNVCKLCNYFYPNDFIKILGKGKVLKKLEENRSNILQSMSFVHTFSSEGVHLNLDHDSMDIKDIRINLSDSVFKLLEGIIEELKTL